MPPKLYLAAYDIRDAQRLRQALQVVRAYATGGQRSVHEVLLDAGQKQALLAAMRALLAKEDHFLLLALDARAPVLVRGRGLPPVRPHKPFYLD